MVPMCGACFPSAPYTTHSGVSATAEAVAVRERESLSNRAEAVKTFLELGCEPPKGRIASCELVMEPR